MQTDSVIITSVILGFGIFFLVHCILFRLIEKPDMMRAMTFLSVAGCVGFFGGTWFLIHTLESRYIIVVSLIYGMTYIVLWFSYVMGVFILFDSSLRMKYLLLISSYGKQGIDEKRLRELSTIGPLIKKRLDRLVASGEVKKSGSQYMLGSKLSLLLVREKLAEWTKHLYDTHA
jgi:predicted permease